MSEKPGPRPEPEVFKAMRRLLSGIVIPAAPAPNTFTCVACGTGPWDLAWDPHEQPVMGRRGGRICPNCSGAD